MQENSFYKKYFPEINYLIINTKPSNFFNPRNLPHLDNREENKFNQNYPNNELAKTISFERFIKNPLFKGKKNKLKFKLIIKLNNFSDKLPKSYKEKISNIYVYNYSLNKKEILIHELEFNINPEGKDSIELNTYENIKEFLPDIKTISANFFNTLLIKNIFETLSANEIFFALKNLNCEKIAEIVLIENLQIPGLNQNACKIKFENFQSMKKSFFLINEYSEKLKKHINQTSQKEISENFRNLDEIVITKKSDANLLKNNLTENEIESLAILNGNFDRLSVKEENFEDFLNKNFEKNKIFEAVFFEANSNDYDDFFIKTPFFFFENLHVENLTQRFLFDFKKFIEEKIEEYKEKISKEILLGEKICDVENIKLNNKGKKSKSKLNLDKMQLEKEESKIYLIFFRKIL